MFAMRSGFEAIVPFRTTSGMRKMYMYDLYVMCGAHKTVDVACCMKVYNRSL